nr:DUF6625 family protein [uncultured Rhodopila sp.]
MSVTLGIAVEIESPYKVCDFRPVFWALLTQATRPYQYWGHCDIDMVFGNLGNYITRDLLAQYDKIFTVGHLTLYRNCSLANEMFSRPYPRFDWRAILSESRHLGFDEHIGINRIWQEHGGRTFEDETLIADIDPAIRRYERAAPNRNYRHQLFYFERGHVYRGYSVGSQWKTEEFMYIHFQKRQTTNLPTWGSTRYAIAPGGFYDLPEGASLREFAESLNRGQFYWRECLHRWRGKFRSFRRRCGMKLPVLQLAANRNSPNFSSSSF